MEFHPLFFVMEVRESVKELISPYVTEKGIELVDILYRREGQGMVLRLLMDKEGGIRLSECEELNNYLSARLDETGIIDERYILEVSSPGLDRPMKSDRDFQRSMGREIEVDTYEPVDGRRHIVGSLIGMDAETVVVESSGISTVIPRSKIAMARLKIEV